MTSLTRRFFLKQLLDGGLKAAAVPAAVKVLLEAREANALPISLPAHQDTELRKVDFFERLENKGIRCGVCPNRCVLDDGETGICRARTNHDGVHYNHAYANPCILSVDPVEKLPMNNFYPGSEVVCVAVGGCNLRCLYCQNWEWSQKRPDDIKRKFSLGPGEAVHSVLKKDIRTVAFTYTEPIAFLEYISDIADIAANSGVRCVAASNGFATKPAARKMAEKLDGITIGLKGFDDAFYEKVCGAKLKPVLETIEEINSSGTCWVELTTLIVPTYNDDKKKIKEMALWIRKNVGTKVPWHFARFVPKYRLANVPRTPVSTLDDAMKIALDAGLEYVYTSNIAPHKGNNTRCPRCGRMLIERIGFKIIKNEIKTGRCRCGNRIPGFFDSAEPV